MSISIDHLANTYNRLIEIRETIEALQEEKTVIENALKTAIGFGNTATIGGKPVAKYYTYETRQFLQKDFKEEHPELAAEYTRIVQRETFRIVTEDENE